MISKTISQVVNNNLCTGCGTCVALCPFDAIKLIINEKKGIYVPTLNEEKCNKCGICLNVCPGHSVDFKALNIEVFGKEPDNFLIGNYLNCYIGFANDYNIRYNSTSGGLITQLLMFALEEGMISGALVTRMNKDHPLEPEPFIARTVQDILEASTSKYCPVPANIALREILKSNENEKFAVVGLPCHIHGMRKAEQINKKLKNKIVFHFGIACNHSPTFLATEFSLHKTNVKKQDIIKLGYRGEGWPGKMKIELENNILKVPPLSYWGGGVGPCFSPIRCTLCCDHNCELADISFADAWLPEIQEKDNVGSSIIIYRNEIVRGLLDKATRKGKIDIIMLSSMDVVRSQAGVLNSKKNKLGGRISLFNLIGKSTPKYNLKLPNSKLTSYFNSIFLYLRIYFSSKRYLWNLILIGQSFYYILFRASRLHK